MPRTYITSNGSTLTVSLPALGSGQFGTAYKVKTRKGETLCVKEMVNVATMDEVDRQQALNEVRVMQTMLKHPNIVRYYDSWFDRGNLCILMEYVSGGSLKSLLSAFKSQRTHLPEKKVVHYVEELAEGLHYCHTQLHVIHRDVKPDNILIDSLGTLKLADFGLSKKVKGNRMAETLCGTPLYMSPEQLKYSQYTFSADVWALGCCVYEMMALHMPWVNSDTSPPSESVLFERIGTAAVQWDLLREYGYSERIRNLCRCMLQRSVERRWCAHALVEFLELRAPPALDATLPLPRAPPALDATLPLPPAPTMRPSPTAPPPPPTAPPPSPTAPPPFPADTSPLAVPEEETAAAGRIQASVRRSFERQRRKTPPVLKPLAPMDREAVPIVVPKLVVDPSTDHLKRALRQSLNRRRRDTRTLRRMPSSRPLLATATTAVPDPSLNAIVSNRLKELAAPRPNRRPPPSVLRPLRPAWV
jgi:serine/threonine protein kinase